MAKKPTPEDIFYEHLTLGLMGTLGKSKGAIVHVQTYIYTYL